jgi:hypothetical protein
MSPVGSLGRHVRAKRFHSVSLASQWELRPTVPFPSCFLYNPKFPASQLLGLPPAFTLISWSAYSTLKMEAICFFETSVEFQRTTGYYTYIPEDSTLHNHRCENLKSYMFFSLSAKRVYILFCICSKVEFGVTLRRDIVLQQMLPVTSLWDVWLQHPRNVMTVAYWRYRWNKWEVYFPPPKKMLTLLSKLQIFQL